MRKKNRICRTSFLCWRLSQLRRLKILVSCRVIRISRELRFFKVDDSRGVFYFFPGPEFKKPQSPGKAKKDYLPTPKRHESNRFTVDAAVNLDGCSSWGPGFDSRPCRTPNAWRKKEKCLFFHGKKKRILAPNDDLTTYLPPTQAPPKQKKPPRAGGVITRLSPVFSSLFEKIRER